MCRGSAEAVPTVQMNRKSPKMDPPEPPEPCPGCGACPPPINSTVTFRDEESGAVEGDLECGDCGHLLESGVLFSEPDHV